MERILTICLRVILILSDILLSLPTPIEAHMGRLYSLQAQEKLLTPAANGGVQPSRGYLGVQGHATPENIRNHATGGTGTYEVLHTI